MDLDKLNNQARFIEMIVSGKLVISKKKKVSLVAELRAKDFKPIPKVIDAKKQGEFEPIVEEQETEEEAAEAVKTCNDDFDYLLGVRICPSRMARATNSTSDGNLVPHSGAHRQIEETSRRQRERIRKAHLHLRQAALDSRP